MNERIEISRSVLVDALMARSALIGDITGRGWLLTDNDDAALTAVLDTAIPAAVSSCGMNCNKVDAGWCIAADGICPDVASMTAYLIDYVIRVLRDAVAEVPAPMPIPDVRLIGYD